MPSTLVKVFVSSTWEDLQSEREEIEKALHRLCETKFIGMEYFGSRDETTIDVSLEEVKHSDIYIGIFGKRYGSGITEAEYRQARKHNLPCFIYFKDESAIPQKGRERNAVQAAKLTALKQELRQNHTVTEFRSGKDLALAIIADLHRWLLDEFNVAYHLVQGISSLPTDYSTRIRGFFIEYLGTEKHPVPFGGREADIAILDSWLDKDDAPPYLLLTAHAGRGKSALLVRWSQRLHARKDLVVVFIPVSIRFRTNLASVVFPALTARLANLHGEKVPRTTDQSVEIWREMAADYLARSLHDGRRILLILDGVDEAADWLTGPDFFSSAPSSGLRIVISARYLAGDKDDAPWLRRLGWDHPGLARSQQLTSLTQEGVADVLQRMDFPLDELGLRVDIVTELHRLTQGDPLMVRLYVDDLWAKGEVATRLQPEELLNIRPGIEGYFERWWEDQRSLWGDKSPVREKSVQTLLNLLSCALGPLRREDMLRLAQADIGLNTWTLDEALQPLARIVIGDGREQGYVFSHPLLGIYFYERLTSDEQRQWESIFLAWGKEILDALNNKTLLPEKAPPYLIQYYGAHLERGEQALDALLGLVSDGWHMAWETFEGSYTGFLNDVDHAWQAVEQADEAEINNGYLAPHLGHEIRCALCWASVNSMAKNIYPDLQVALVKKRVWTPTQGLAYAHQVPDFQQRAKALIGLAPHLPESLKWNTLQEARVLADKIRDQIGGNYHRTVVLIELTPHLQEPLKTKTVKEVVTAAYELQKEYRGYDNWKLANLGKYLAELAPHLPELLKIKIIQVALALISKIENLSDRTDLLAALAPHMPEPSLREALKTARQIKWEKDRIWRLATLIPYLPEPLKKKTLREALSAVKVIRLGRGEILPALAPYLSDALLQEALQDGVFKMLYDDSRNENLKKLAPHLPEAFLREVLTAVRDNRINRIRASVDMLIILIPYLPESLLHEALAAARKVKDESERTDVLTALISRLPEPLKMRTLEEALAVARMIRDAENRGLRLAGLAQHLPESWRIKVMQEALASVYKIGLQWRRINFLTTLAPNLSESLLREALVVTREIGDEYDRAKIFTVLVPYLPDSLRQKAWVTARKVDNVRNRAEVLTALAPHLSEPLKTKALAEALVAAHAIEEGDGVRTRALMALLPHLPESLQQEALAAVRASQYPSTQVKLFVVLANSLSEPLKSDILKEALIAAREIKGEYNRVNALVELLPYLPEPLKKEVLKEALVVTYKSRYVANTRIAMLVSLVPHLPKRRKVRILRKALAMAYEIEDGHYRAENLAVLVPHLPKAWLRDVLASTHMNRFYKSPNIVVYEYERAKVLTKLAPYLPESLQQEALSIIYGIKDSKGQAEALTALAPYLNESLKTRVLNEAFLAARSYRVYETVIKTLTSILPHMSEALKIETIEETLELVRLTEDPIIRVRVQAALIPYLQEPLKMTTMEEALEATREIKHYYYPTEIMEALTPHLPESLLRKALSVACEIPDDDRTRAFTALAQHLVKFPSATIYPLWRATLRIVAAHPRRYLLQDLEALRPVMIALGGKKVLTETCRAVQDVGCWWP